MRRQQSIWASVLVILLSSWAPLTSAQQDDRIVVGTNLVTVNVIVTDSKGKYVKGLSQEQFSIFDERVKQQIAHFSADNSPVSIGILCEIHERSPEQSKAIFSALRQFTAALTKEDEFFLIAFNQYGSLTTDFIPTFNQVADYLRQIRPEGPSAFYDAAYLAATRLKRSRQLKRALIIISDGHDTNSRHSYSKLRDQLRTMDAQVYTIGISDPELDRSVGESHWFYEDVSRDVGRRTIQITPELASGRAVLDELSRESGGMSFIPESRNEAELAHILSQLAREIHQQYTLTFYSNGTLSGNWHKIKVLVQRPQRQADLKLSYRHGYLIDGKP